MRAFISLLLLLSLGGASYGLMATETACDQPQREHLALHFSPEQASCWHLETQKVRPNGRIYAIYFKEGSVETSNERLVLVTSPLGPEEQGSVEKMVQHIQDGLALSTGGGGQRWHVYKQSTTEAVICFGEEGEGLIVARILLTPYAYHTASYCYEGPDTATIDVSSWCTFLQEALCIAEGLPPLPLVRKR